MSEDILKRLQACAIAGFSPPERSLALEAAAEIARLREERLTAGEREALELSLELEWPKTSEQWKALAACLGPVCVAPANKHKVAIRGLLNRMPLPPGPDPKEANRE